MFVRRVYRHGAIASMGDQGGDGTAKSLAFRPKNYRICGLSRPTGRSGTSKIMVKIRLSRAGAKKRPFYHVVATDSRKARDGRFIERLGYYNPKATGDEKQLVIDRSRVAYWQGTGAQVSDRVTFLLAHVASTTDTTKAAEAAPAA
jgi:small subunit ribosomal protein S16